jgi:hypothetical protein
LHTTHSAKYGSRVGLGITFIKFGLDLRTKAEQLIETGQFPSDPADPPPPAGTSPEDIAAENAIAAYWGPGSPWPATLPDPTAELGTPPVTFHNAHEAEVWAASHNTTLSALLGMPSAVDVGRANEWFSFMLMTVGWFLVLTSIGGWWRVKRFEAGLKRAARESEEARAAALRIANGEDEAEPITTTSSREGPGPTSLLYYTSAFSQALVGAREIQQGFFGRRGRQARGDGHGHAQLAQDDAEHELLDAQGFGLSAVGGGGAGETMATTSPASARSRGLWGGL